MNLSQKTDEMINELKRLKKLIDEEEDEEKKYYLILQFEKMYNEFDQLLKQIIEGTKN